MEKLDRAVIAGDIERCNKIISNLKKISEEIIDYAKKHHQEFMKTGELDGNLLQACLLLAQTDVIFRAGKPPNNYGKVEERDVDDLFELMKAINIKEFIAKDHLLLNPTFGEASSLVGGADADIMMDRVLIDIKTTKYLDFKREYFDQLIGYYILKKIGDIDDTEEEIKIRELGIYFSRHAQLVKFLVKDVIDNGKLDEFIEWFIERAKFHFYQNE